MRTRSQNVTFTGVSVGDDEFEPPGHGIATRLRERLRLDGFAADEEDNWRDCGWSIGVTYPDIVIQIAITRIADPGLWIAQVAALNEPGLVARLLGRRFVSREQEVLAVAQCLHRWLVEHGFASIKWSVDAFPDEFNSSSEPAINAALKKD